MRAKEEVVTIATRLPPATFDAVQKLASADERSLAITVRRLVEVGLRHFEVPARPRGA